MKYEFTMIISDGLISLLPSRLGYLLCDQSMLFLQDSCNGAAEIALGA